METDAMDKVVHNARLQLSALYAVSKLLASSLDLRRTLGEVLRVLAAYLDLRRCTVYLLRDGGEIHAVASSGMTASQLELGRFRPGEGIVGRIFTTDVPALIPDVGQDPDFLNRTGCHVAGAGETVTFIGVPIKDKGRTIGVLSADRVFVNRDPVNYDSLTSFLAMVANLIGQTLALHEAVAAEREFLLRKDVAKVEPATGDGFEPGDMIGVSPAMRRVMAEVRQVAPSGATVLIRGESGTGKELVARAIHELSPRRKGPFVKVNCAALSENLLESELFGHERGAFTGAVQARKGRFEMADGGTLFLDEIGEISAAFQAKLLRVLQEGEFERVGGNKTIRVNVRLLAATNRNLEEAVGRGEFRQDLYFRINVVGIFTPPLRERPEDIPPLIDHFLDQLEDATGRRIRLSDKVITAMQRCCWPGNVRELRNCVERLVAMATSDVVGHAELACSANRCFSNVLWEYRQRQDPGLVSPPPAAFPPAAFPPAAFPPAAFPPAAAPPPGLPPVEDAVTDMPRERLVSAMEKAGWVQAKAARLLGLSPRQIGYALRKHAIPIKKI